MDLVSRHGMDEVFGCARMYLGPAPDLAHDRIFGVITFISPISTTMTCPNENQSRHNTIGLYEEQTNESHRQPQFAALLPRHTG